MPYGLKEIELEKLDVVFAANERIERVVLYGSRAKGNYKPFSDVDITLEGPELTHTDLSRLSLAIDDLLLPYQFDISIFHTLKNEALIDHIRRIGITIYERKSEWKDYKLGDVVTFQRGHDLPKDKMIDGDIPVAGSNGIIGYHNHYTAKGPGVTIGRSGNIGIPHYYPNAYWAHNTVLYIIDFKGNDAKFLYYLLKTFDFTQLNTGSAVPSLNRNHIHELPVSIPDLPTQHRIASILSSLDDKIDLLHRENATLEQMAETLFRQWFVEEAKEEWEEGKLGDEFAFTMGQSPSGDSFNEEGIGVPMYQGNADFGFRFPTRRVYTTKPTRFAEVNDTLISVRAPVGAQNMATEKCCIGRGVAAFRYKNNPSYYSYTYYKLKSLLEEIKQFNDNGTVFGSISKADFENLDTVIPDEKTILRFQQQVKIIDDKIIINNKEIQTLIQTRDGLLPRLMGGGKKVK